MSNQSPPPMATPRMAAGMLFRDEQGDILMVKPTYKAGWDIPGGYVEPGESPAQAASREVLEELGLTREPGRLLVIDWAPADSEGDKVLFVFDGGLMSSREFAETANRLHLAADAADGGVIVYAEHGVDLRSRAQPAS